MRLAERVAPQLAQNGARFRVLDLCTGSGCIALLLAHTWAGAQRPLRITAVDCDACAVTLAKENAARNRLDVDVVQADMLDDATCSALGTFDVVVCNPPYIRGDEWLMLPSSVRDYEARGALVGHAADDGLAYYRRLAGLARAGLVQRPGGVLAMEVGAGQADDVVRLFRDYGECEVWDDCFGHRRVVLVSFCARPSSTHHVPFTARRSLLLGLGRDAVGVCVYP